MTQILATHSHNLDRADRLNYILLEMKTTVQYGA